MSDQFDQIEVSISTMSDNITGPNFANTLPGTAVQCIPQIQVLISIYETSC